ELKRLKTESRLVDGSQMLTTAYHYDAADQRLFSVRTGTDGTNRITLSGATYDTAGRPIYQTNALGGVTVLTYGADKEGRAVTTNRYADGGIRVETANRDGSLHQVHGSAIHGIRFDYGVAADGKLFTKETKLTQAGQPTEEWILHYADLLGRPCKTQYADGAFAQSFFNAQGQLFKERDPDGVITLYAYSPRGERTLTAVRTVATNRSDRIDFAGTDRIVQTLRDVCFNPALGTVVHRSRTFVWGAFQFNRSNLVASLETSVDGLKTWRILWNEGQGRTNLSSSSYGPGGLRHQSDYAPDGSCTYQRYRYGRLELNETRDAAGTALLQTVYEYDAHNRLRAQTDRRNGTTTFAYNDADLVTRVTTPAPEPREPPQVTLTHFNLMLQPTNVVFPDKTSAYTEYHLTGEIRRRHGARTYPVAYAYDYAGRVRTLTTWKEAADQQSAAVTTFEYHPRRGWLERKRYADSQGPAYQYYASGKLRKRTWARATAPGSGLQVETLYAYNPGGDLESITYNDALTPNLQYGYDRRGRLIQITQGTAQTLLSYNQIGQAVRETYPSGPLAGLWLTNGYDRLLRRSSFHLNSSPFPLHLTYSYDALSRLQGISNGQYSATYVYATNSSLVKSIQLKDQDQTRLSISRDYDALQRLLSSTSLPSGSALLNYEYAYNDA
ncbi:MAG TPA: hypothetical protein VNT26_08780, partial [Candidatus Sulfotelmatobacter sp.]|nr:hypothetical protein [Candidatus Sulfotelmatobacter sp.]